MGRLSEQSTTSQQEFIKLVVECQQTYDTKRVSQLGIILSRGMTGRRQVIPRPQNKQKQRGQLGGLGWWQMKLPDGPVRQRSSFRCPGRR